MKTVLILLFMASVLEAGTAAVEGASLATRTINGREYARLEEWGAAAGFKFQWRPKNPEVELTSQWSRLIFLVDSRKSLLNGTSVWLLAPVVLLQGAPWISVLDLETAVQPILYPAKNARGDPLRVIYLDPGHGGRDSGNRAGDRQEKAYALLLARELKDLLAKEGFEVHLTRSSDRFVELPDRPKAANRNHADLFISLHFNSTENDAANVKGVEVYCLTPARASSTNAGGRGADNGAFAGNRFNRQNVLLAYEVQKALVTGGAADRGVRWARFAVLRDAEMPAILVEGGFLSHPAESKQIGDAAYRRRLAQAIVKGVLAYRRQVAS